MSDNMDAWKISEKDFPKDGSVNDKLVFIARYAMLGPSLYNTQPWIFEVKEETLYVFLDRRYGLPVVDPDDRRLFTNCASTIFLVRAASKYFGYEAHVELLPEKDNSELLAKVKLGPTIEPTEEDLVLFKAITKRHMNRGPFQPGRIDDNHFKELKAAASKEGGWLHVCSDPERKYITRMIIEADRIQYSKKRFKREMANWIDPRRTMTGDGMPDLGLTHDKVINSLSPTVARRFTDTDGKVVSDEHLESEIPVLAILGSTSNDPIERIYAGQAYMRVLLTAQSFGLGITPLSQPLEVPEMRLSMHDELDIHGRAQIIMRIGYPKKKAIVFPRRPVENMILGADFRSNQTSHSKKTQKSGFGTKISRLFLAKRA